METRTRRKTTNVFPKCESNITEGENPKRLTLVTDFNQIASARGLISFVNNLLPPNVCFSLIHEAQYTFKGPRRPLLLVERMYL